ncbi:hypothetical protein TEA_020777 [Camellia sinensis var. sinensis]|uniref:HIRAN domain-containing protein n=1 Tax=Camellia sinensis var. sinensis TaxID=542762 RepID=A0A4S4DFL1_CAMSN|nr:hypothetical protein TEA_020777 [Camellia sinensis var. sinensis]
MTLRGQLVGHLVASVPRIHSRRAPCILEPMYFLPWNSVTNTIWWQDFPHTRKSDCLSLFTQLSVGDINQYSKSNFAAQLGGFMAFLVADVPSQAHWILELTKYDFKGAVGRLVASVPGIHSRRAPCILEPMYFLPANEVPATFPEVNDRSPLTSLTLTKFSGHLYPPLVAIKRSLIFWLAFTSLFLIVCFVRGPVFSDISKVVQFEHVSAICLLVASIQRSTGLWRLQEHDSNNFLLKLVSNRMNRIVNRSIIITMVEATSSSSTGLVTAQFLAVFLAASGKTSVQFSESDESDPDKTWQRLRNISVLHDAIPYSNNRVNHPMHVKSKKDVSSFGWVYSGTYNFSAAAWGRPISNSLTTKAVGAVKTNSVLGLGLHVCNYELGIVFIVPPSDANGSPNHKSRSLDDIILPFVVPAPKYRPSDTPATKQAIREAVAEWEREISLKAVASGELMEEEIPDEEEEVLEATDYVAKE